MRPIDADALKRILGLSDDCKTCRIGGTKNCQLETFNAYGICTMLDDAPTVMPKPDWIPFSKRPLTDEGKKMHPEWCYILDCEVPEDEQEILLYRPWNNKEGYIIEMDRYINNGDNVYLEGAMDIENGMFWMPLPEPPKVG